MECNFSPSAEGQASCGTPLPQAISLQPPSSIRPESWQRHLLRKGTQAHPVRRCFPEVHVCVPMRLKRRVLGPMAAEQAKELGCRLTVPTRDRRETARLAQRIFIVTSRRNAATVLATARPAHANGQAFTAAIAAGPAPNHLAPPSMRLRIGVSYRAINGRDVSAAPVGGRHVGRHLRRPRSGA